MADLMRENDIPLFSLESRTPIRDFDLLGVTLQYEMSYTNILDALDLAGIPLRAADRTDGPFVIVGGPCAFNPEPLAPFVDLVAIGDGEDETHQVIDCYKAWKASGAPREEFLRAAAKIRGVYVPSLYDVNYNEDGAVASIRPKEGSGAPEVVLQGHGGEPDRGGLSRKAHRALRRGGAQPHHAGDLPRLHPRLPLLSGGHDLPPRARAQHGSAHGDGGKAGGGHGLRRDFADEPVQRRLFAACRSWRTDMVEKFAQKRVRDFAAVSAHRQRC